MEAQAIASRSKASGGSYVGAGRERHAAPVSLTPLVLHQPLSRAKPSGVPSSQPCVRNSKSCGRTAHTLSPPSATSSNPTNPNLTPNPSPTSPPSPTPRSLTLTPTQPYRTSTLYLYPNPCPTHVPAPPLLPQPRLILLQHRRHCRLHLLWRDLRAAWHRQCVERERERH